MQGKGKLNPKPKTLNPKQSKGKLTVTFDNSYSWFRSKTFDYHIKVADANAISDRTDSESASTSTSDTVPHQKMAGEADTWDFMGIKEETDNLLDSFGLGQKPANN